MNRIARHEPRSSAAVSVAAACLLLACAGSPNTLALAASNPTREVANAAALREVITRHDTERSAPAPSAAGQPALAVIATTDELIAARLDRALKDARVWRAPIEAAQGAVQPALVPGLVVLGSAKSLIGLALEDGKKLWTLPARERVLLAATADTERLALLLLDRRGRRSLAVYDRPSKGAPRERLRVTAEAVLGTPALLDGALLVPWGQGQLSAVDVSDPIELARTRLGLELLHALWWGDALFFGGPPWVELTGHGNPPYALPRRPLPGVVQGALPSSGASVTATGATPLDTTIDADVTRLYVQPVAAHAEGTNRASDHYMATYGRVAFGLERERGALAWVVALPGRALASLAVDDRFIVCDDSGAVRVLASATGHTERSWQLTRQRRATLGQPTATACALAPGAMLTDAAEDAASASGAAAAPLPLLDQLAQVLALSDPGLSDAQRFLARELAARAEPEATRVLIELVRRHSLERVLQSEAEDLLATRRNGEDHMLAALAADGPRGEDSLPPIAPLGEALAALGEKRAAPLLARQLNRPAHTASAIARAAAALEQLASENEYAELSVFFSLHRTNADGPEWVAAVVSVGRTLLRVGGQRARALIQFATRDPLTIPEIKSALEQALGAGLPSVSSDEAPSPDEKGPRRDIAG
ncbi:MAG TPA: hypothetical protein VMG12_21030 [Polyangiaceae bacterium]|nr:hypothetical protein [Polyangiaceae bacterium]